MAKELNIRVGEEVGSLVLFDDAAPKTCKKIMESLPLKSAAIIAKVAGSELMMRILESYSCDGNTKTSPSAPAPNRRLHTFFAIE